MKLSLSISDNRADNAAAFGRLCVETARRFKQICNISAAAFGRLCVETLAAVSLRRNDIAAAFGRLCVETVQTARRGARVFRSRLRAAVC